ncbi:MAG TPA: heterodisulfide reductase-related iron-sulfur binding cluster [Longimicrobiales bacterium]|nr:heterodisulfide reductase-related iron-sulfur binding cluster [Longimicrobiales bacterium]
MKEETASEAPRVASLARALAAEEDKLLACVHCGFCLPACPTYNRLGNEADSPRGRLHLMRAVVEGRLEADSPGFDLHIDQCLGCRMCEPVCPAGVRYGFLLERARAVIAEARGVAPTVRVMLGVFRRPWLMRTVLALARVFRDTGLARGLLRLTPAGLGRVRFALAMLAGSAPQRGRRAITAPPAGVPPRPAPSTPPSTTSAAILTGCVQGTLFDRVNRATRKVLRARGCELVHAKGQGCCGALHAHAGLLDDATAMARRNVVAFDESGAELIAVNAAGCGAFMKEYGELLHGEAEYAAAATRVSARTRDVSEILVHELAPLPSGAGTAPSAQPGVPSPPATTSSSAAGGADGTSRKLRVAYDEACHLHHGQGVHVEPYRLLQSMPFIELVPLERAAECCGGAGIYGLTHPDLGGRILKDKIDAIQAAAPDVVATANPGCAMQIAAGLLLRGDATPVVHPMELLARADASAAPPTGT